MTKEISDNVENEVADDKIAVIEENGDLGDGDMDDNVSTTPMLDMVKASTPHEFGEVTTDALNVRARSRINDQKEAGE